jgi:hypothetical protein
MSVLGGRDFGGVEADGFGEAGFRVGDIMNREDIMEDHAIPLTQSVQESIRRLHAVIDVIKMRDAIDRARRAKLPNNERSEEGLCSG